MASFYGNMKNNSRASFIFDKIYSSRCEMEDALYSTSTDGKPLGDGIFVNRYVLVDYGYTLNENSETVKTHTPMYRVVEGEGLRSIGPESFNLFYVKKPDGKTFCHPSELDDPTLRGYIPPSATPASGKRVYYIRKAYIDKYHPVFSEPTEFMLAPISSYDWRYGLYYVKSGNSYVKDTATSYSSNKEYYIAVNVDGGPIPDLIYQSHKLRDLNRYQNTYDRTVWQKVYADGGEHYILIAELDAKAPKISVIGDSPDCSFDAPHFDNRASNLYEYIYHAPKNWEFVFNDSTTSTRNNYTNTTKAYYYYEKDLSAKTYDTKVNYPYLNQEGFEPRILHKVEISVTATGATAEGIFLRKTKSGNVYPVHSFKHVYLTEETYWPNTYYIGTMNTSNRIKREPGEAFNIDYAYYIVSNSKYIYVPLRLSASGNEYEPVNYNPDTTYYYLDPKKESAYTKDTISLNTSGVNFSKGFDKNKLYFELTWATVPSTSGARARELLREYDTLRIDIYLPTIGNTVSDIWDIIYGTPRKVTGLGTLLGYTNSTTFNSFARSAISEDYKLYRDAIGTTIYLNTTLVSNLYPELYPGVFDIPIYDAAGTNIRPYDDDKLFRSLTVPYDNIDEDMSLGLTLTTMKRYLSELRKLVSGDGVLPDWAIDDDTAIGFIRNKPKLVLSYLLTLDQTAIENKLYFELVEIDKNTATFSYKSVIPNGTSSTRTVKKITYVNGVPNYNTNANTSNLYGEIVFNPIPISETNLLNDKNSGPLKKKLYELPKLKDGSFVEYAPTYTKITKTNNEYPSFDPTQTYYIQKGASYIIAESESRSESLMFVGDETGLLNANCGCTLLGYLVTVGDQLISERRYILNFASDIDNIYLCKNNIMLKDFEIVLSATTTGENAPYLETPPESLTVISFSDKKRFEFLNLLNPSSNDNITSNNIEINPLDDSSYNSSHPDLSASNFLSGIYYAQIKVTETTYALLSDAYDELVIDPGLYIKSTIETRIDASEYEIHNLWNYVKLLTLTKVI